jgi:hypothetical protein
MVRIGTQYKMLFSPAKDLATIPAKSPMDGMRRFAEFSDVIAKQSIQRRLFDVVDDEEVARALIRHEL